MTFAARATSEAAMSGLAAVSPPDQTEMELSNMDTGFVNDGLSCRNMLDEARRQHLLAIQRALKSGVGPEEILTDLVGFDAAANALVALERRPS